MTNRAQPALPWQAMQTHQIVSPVDTTVVVACEQVGCRHWREGWDTIIDERTDLGMAQGAYLRQRSGRTFKEMRTAQGLTVFRFEPRQRCFAEHHTRPELYVVRGGDWRGSTGLIRQHTRPEDWAEDLHEATDHFIERRNRG